MLKVKTVVDVREEWVAALRSGKHRQKRPGANGDTRVCAIDVFYDMARIPFDLATEGNYQSFERMTGLSAGAIFRRNDGFSPHKPHSFAEIAAYVETLPYT